MKRDAEPKLIERRDDYTERWMCDPPANGVWYRVIRQDWNEDFTERTIHEIEMA